MFCSLLGMLPTMKNLQRLQIRQKKFKEKSHSTFLNPIYSWKFSKLKSQVSSTQTPSLKVECRTDDDVWNPVDVVIDLRA